MGTCMCIRSLIETTEFYVQANNKNTEIDLEIDVNTELCPLNVGESFRMTLASKFDLNKKNDSGNYDIDYSDLKDIISPFDYVTNGKIYKVRDIRTTLGPRSEIYVSFGGLLMLLTGFPEDLENLQLDMEIFCLLKK